MLIGADASLQLWVAENILSVTSFIFQEQFYCNLTQLLHIEEMPYFVLLVAQYNFFKVPSTSESNLFVLCKKHGCYYAISLLNIVRLLRHYWYVLWFFAQMIFADLIFDDMIYFLPIWLDLIISDLAKVIFALLIFWSFDFLPKWFLPKWFCSNDFCPFDFCPFDVDPIEE